MQRDGPLPFRVKHTAKRGVGMLTAVITAVAIAASAGCTKSEPMPPIDPPAGKTWNLAFDSGFDGSSLDTTKFSPCFDWNTGDCTSTFNGGKEHYQASQVQVGNGIARLVAEPLDPPKKDGECFEGVCTYKSGMLSTARPEQSQPYLFEFTYGYVEARIKLAKTPGMTSGFWMLPTHRDFQYDHEIDILENLGGKPDVIYQTYQYNDRKDFYKVNDIVRETNGTCPKIDYSADFHTYGMDWQPDHIAFFIDGRECGRFTATDESQIVSDPMQLILSLGVDNDWPRAVNLVLPSQTVSDHLDVDYVRVWQASA